MALDIHGATFGVDANGIATLENNLNVKCIQETITKMNGGIAALREAVDTAWVGQSAENFKDNMETDKEAVVKALNESYEILKGELDDIASKMGEVDQELVPKR